MVHKYAKKEQSRYPSIFTSYLLKNLHMLIAVILQIYIVNILWPSNTKSGKYQKNFIASIVWNLLTPDLAKTSNVKNYYAFWQGARVRNRTIRSNPHNNAQSEKIRKIPHNTEIFTWNFK